MSETISRERRILFIVILVVIVLGIIEFFSQLTYQAIYDTNYHPRRLKRLISQAWVFNGDETGVPNYMRDLIVHPYIGFGINATGAGKMGFGLMQAAPPAQSTQEGGKFRVLVLGGSVAVQTLQSDPETGAARESFIAAAMRRAFAKEGLNIEPWVFAGALPGGKQPQQLMVYTFLTILGGEFDLVLNLDGFNEMTLAMDEAHLSNLHPVYPRGWDTMLGNRLTAHKLRAIAQLLKLREAQASLLDFAETNPLARPTLVGLLLAQRITSEERRANALLSDLHKERVSGELTLEEGGVPFDYTDTQAAYRYLAEVWRRSSISLAHVAAGANTAYLHVFQPNQYLEGSKPLTAEETARHYIPEGGFGVHYRGAYPAFHAEMDRLRDARVWFVDASMLFADESRTVYVDACCHFNEYGVRALADYIAEVAAKSVEGRADVMSVLPHIGSP